ncbi:MAG: NADPH:quinone oxidoreductase family protein [Bacteroidota bacterium]
MKKWNIIQPGDLNNLKPQDFSPNGLKDRHVRINTKAIGMNPADLMQVMGTHQNPPPPPFSPGFEIAGIVTESNASRFKEGDRVMASMDYGAYQECVDVEEQLVEIIPEAVSYTAAAAIPISYGTAYVSLIHRGQLKPNQTLLVLGATGGVGSRMVEIAAALGARVVATYSKDNQQEYLKSLGANQLINYREEDLIARVKEMTNNKGVDMVADLVGGDLFKASLDCVAWGGSILPIGVASGKIPQLNSIDMLIRNTSLIGTDFAAYITREPGVVQQTFKKIFDWYKEGKLGFSEPSNVLPFDEADRALEQLSKGELKGKSVLKID